MVNYSKKKEYARILEKLNRAEPLTEEELKRFRHIVTFSDKKRVSKMRSVS